MKSPGIAASVLIASLQLLRLNGASADTQAPDPDLPQPLSAGLTQGLLEHPPFTRAIDLSDSLALTGIAYVLGRPVATLTDKATKKNYLVSDKPNELGWKLAEATPSTEFRYTSVKIQVGSEVVTIRYGNAQLTPTKSAKFPSDAEAIRKDENGQPYVRGSAYLSEGDRERYYRGWSREGHDKFRDDLRNNRETLLKASPEERAAYSKKLFDTIDAQERARPAQPAPQPPAK